MKDAGGLVLDFGMGVCAGFRQHQGEVGTGSGHQNWRVFSGSMQVLMMWLPKRCSGEVSGVRLENRMGGPVEGPEAPRNQ